MPENEIETTDEIGDREAASYVDDGEPLYDDTVEVESDAVDETVEPEPTDDGYVEPEPEAEPVAVPVARTRYAPTPLPDIFTSEEEEGQLRDALGDDAFNAVVAIANRIAARNSTVSTNTDVQLTQFAENYPDAFREFGTGMRQQIGAIPETLRGTEESAWAALLMETDARARKSRDWPAEIRKLSERLNGGTPKPAPKPAAAPAVAKQAVQARTPSGSAAAAAPVRRPAASAGGGSRLNAEGRYMVDEIGMTEAEVLAMGR